jgi:hypothetical protein
MACSIVSRFADEDHVRRLAQGVLQRRRPRVGIDADLALRDDAVPVVMHILNRVLDGDNVTEAVFVAVADHRRQRGRLARARAADEQHQAALGHPDILQHAGQAEVLEFRDRGVDGAHDEAGTALLHEGIDAEAADAGRADGEVAFLGRLEFRRLLVIHHRVGQLERVLGRQRLRRNRRHLAIDLDRGWKPGGDEQVGTLLLHHHRQQLVQEL